MVRVNVKHTLKIVNCDNTPGPGRCIYLFILTVYSIFYLCFNLAQIKYFVAYEATLCMHNPYVYTSVEKVLSILI